MSPAELAPDRVLAMNPLPPVVTGRWVTGWGGGPRTRVNVARPEATEELRLAVAGQGRRGAITDGGAIARGMGRSYGDAAQLRGGLVVETTALRRIELDADSGTAWVQAGVTLGELLAVLEPGGWVLPVVPGTQHVSVGGAIAADVHGKNHGSAGTFGMHVLALGLLIASGEIRELAPEHDEELMGATIGGMGLTGVIVWARLRLKRLGSALMAVDVDRVERLDDALGVLDGPGGPHRVAWLDLLGPRPVRGVVTRAEHVIDVPGDDGRARTTVSARMTVPRRWPACILRTEVVRAHNEYRFRRAPRRALGRLDPFGAHMFPLDVLDAWPRLYGPAGFIQYQLVVPRGREPALEAVIGALRRSSAPCFLAVLKDLGGENHAPLSFPLRGWTLALDLPRAAPGLWTLLDRFDEIVAEAGGRVYLAKDGRLRADTLAAMYPRLDAWRTVRDRVDPERIWRSDLGVRTGLVRP